MPQNLQIYTIFGDPQNFIVSKIPSLTISRSRMPKEREASYIIDKIMTGL